MRLKSERKCFWDHTRANSFMRQISVFGNAFVRAGNDPTPINAIIIMLWVSALASAFFDSIPVKAVMVKIIPALSDKAYLGLPMQPLVWMLAFGPCLGGNGPLVGASANVICASIAEQHGYRFSFMNFFRLGFPIMLVSVIVPTGYLMTTHVVFDWH